MRRPPITCLRKITLRCRCLQRRQVHAIKVRLLPEGGLGRHLAVQQGIGEGGNMDAAHALQAGGGESVDIGTREAGAAIGSGLDEDLLAFCYVLPLAPELNP